MDPVLSEPFFLTGTRECEPETQILKAGALTAELIGGNLRCIAFGGVEVLRGLSFLVRDRDWGTCEAEVSALQVVERDEGFRVTYRAMFTAPDGARLTCDADISANAHRLTFTAAFTPDKDFETARAGFCVLHPIVGLAGSPVTVEHTDGSIEQATFPDLIEPWQPFQDMRSITHTVTDGVTATCRMDGDVFEMEDQRQWTDGSFKTYVRPLALPWPYSLQAGETLHQSVTLDTEGQGPVGETRNEPVHVSIGDVTGRMPELGLGLRPEDALAEQQAIKLALESAAQHLICHFDPTAGHGVDALRGFALIAAATGLRVTLECVVPCIEPLNTEFSRVKMQVVEAGLVLDTLAVSPSVDRQSTPPGSVWPACPPLEDVYAAARSAFPDVRLAGGMFSYFPELNRKRVPGAPIDIVTHCTNPIVHAADDVSVMQTMEALAFVVRSVRAIYGDKPYHIGPSTIAMRQNPYGSATKDNPGLKRIAMANVDPRHNGLFGAAWTIAYMATVAPAGLDVLTVSTLAGPFGLIAGQGEPVEEGKPRPLFEAVKAIGALAGAACHRVTSNDETRIRGFAAEVDGGTPVLWLANITPRPQTVRLENSWNAISVMDADSLANGQRLVDAPVTDSEVSLPPYAIARMS
ncbi:hypothetical protein IFT84_03325 [Rhizobium sp. CFBP 8762]|uniref:D-apionate lactonase n=1 Tax=Rhizobium sp. CFBP 8762 TaxID=2775279 RepID=UPI00177AB3AB|nr:hypothetical protein [Rhizobium sp. CFBP 8762]MBD8553546.1 hypothetical protein [Rhizobium sp. CFBP 8762]